MSSKEVPDERIQAAPTADNTEPDERRDQVSVEVAEPNHRSDSGESSSATPPDQSQPDDAATESSPVSQASASDGSVESSETASEKAAAVGDAQSDAAASPGTTASETRRRLRLNPANQADIKAIPSLGPGQQAAAQPKPAQPFSPPAAVEPSSPSGDQPQSASPEAESSPEEAAVSATQEQSQASAPAPPRRPSAPVEIPTQVEDLDADLEAEINAALSQPEVQQPEVEQDLAVGDTEEASELEPGTKLKGTVQTVGAENVFVELGFRSPGILQVRQFETGKLPKVGQSIEVIVDRVEADDGLVVLNLPRGRRKVSGDWSALTKGQVVDCMVTKTNKGGLEVSIGNLRGFLPAGQVDLHYTSDLEPYVGQKLTVQITEVNPRKRNLVVSRRAHLEVARKEAEKELWKTLEVGQKHSGRVKTLKDYGAFIDLGGVDGFLHIGEISWQRIRHPSDALREGQEVEVTVLQLDPEKKRIGLGMRQLTQNPWLAAAEKYLSGSQVSGRVTRTSDFGAFVELEPGIEGLIHISELDHRRVKRVTDVLKEGQQVDAKVLEVDPDRRRISLSLKALTDAPEPVTKSDEDLAPSAGQKFERKRKTPLKGGTGGSVGGGLFGNPSDFKKK